MYIAVTPCALNVQRILYVDDFVVKTYAGEMNTLREEKFRRAPNCGRRAYPQSVCPLSRAGDTYKPGAPPRVLV